MAQDTRTVPLVIRPDQLEAQPPTFVGSGLMLAGVTDTCAVAMVLSKLPYNRPATCDVQAVIRALEAGAGPAGIGRASLADSPAVRSCAV